MSEGNSIAVMDDVAALETLSVEAQELAVTRMLDQSRQWLDRALEATNPAREVADFKAFIATVAEAAKQKKLSEAIQLDAVEMVRRSERALGVAIRKGQDAGEIGSAHNGAASRHRDQVVTGNSVLPSPTDFAPKHELTNTHGGIYDVTDGVTDEQFDSAIAEAKEEGNLSRANVVRKVAELGTYREQLVAKWDRIVDLASQGYTSHQIARDVEMSEQGLRSQARKKGIDFPADRIVGRSHRIKSDEVLSNIVLSIETAKESLDLVRFSEITPELAGELLQRLTSALGAVSQLKKTLKEISNDQ